MKWQRNTLPFLMCHKKIVFSNIPRKSLEEIQKECEEKIDKRIEDVEYKFAQLKHYQEYRYNQKFDDIIWNFEYAQKKWKNFQKYID